MKVAAVGISPDLPPKLKQFDEKGKIAGAWYKVSPQDTVPKALEALEGKLYSNLVAFAATPDLRGLVFATTRATRKFENPTVDPRVSI